MTFVNGTDDTPPNAEGIPGWRGLEQLGTGLEGQEGLGARSWANPILLESSGFKWAQVDNQGPTVNEEKPIKEIADGVFCVRSATVQSQLAAISLRPDSARICLLLFMINASTVEAEHHSAKSACHEFMGLKTIPADRPCEYKQHGVPTPFKGCEFCEVPPEGHDMVCIAKPAGQSGQTSIGMSSGSASSTGSTSSLDSMGSPSSSGASMDGTGMGGTGTGMGGTGTGMGGMGTGSGG
ncbi:hypothetical protein FB446DRAFT_707044 [Lentinula raphanica]|nr:hypothetical protein FB446DRAFT_707044 [Lentinula raphanica]